MTWAQLLFFAAGFVVGGTFGLVVGALMAASATAPLPRPVAVPPPPPASVDVPPPVPIPSTPKRGMVSVVLLDSHEGAVHESFQVDPRKRPNRIAWEGSSYRLSWGSEKDALYVYRQEVR